MFVQERHRAILTSLKRRPRVATELLQGELGISRSTLRRDLMELEHLGEVVRVRGEVVHADFLRGEPSFDRRRARRIAEKQAIARRAAELVAPNSTIYIDAGTTCLEVGRLLMKRPDLRLFTHSIRLVSHATDSEAAVVCVGGEYRRVSDAVVGGLTASWLAELRFDIAFVAASGLDEAGLWTTELSECAVKAAILARSRRNVLVADSEKWGDPKAVRFAGWGRVSDFVTDAGLAEAPRRFVRRAGVNLTVATTRESKGKP